MKGKGRGGQNESGRMVEREEREKEVEENE